MTNINKAIAFPAAKIKTVKEIIGNHHSPARYNYPELVLLSEADRTINQEDRD